MVFVYAKFEIVPIKGATVFLSHGIAFHGIKREKDPMLDEVLIVPQFSILTRIGEDDSDDDFIFTKAVNVIHQALLRDDWLYDIMQKGTFNEVAAGFNLVIDKILAYEERKVLHDKYFAQEKPNEFSDALLEKISHMNKTIMRIEREIEEFKTEFYGP
jgi:hypothetical protein